MRRTSKQHVLVLSLTAIWCNFCELCWFGLVVDPNFYLVLNKDRSVPTIFRIRKFATVFPPLHVLRNKKSI